MTDDASPEAAATAAEVGRAAAASGAEGPDGSGGSEGSDDFDVRLDRVVKRFGDVLAVDHVDLGVRPGEFFTLLGPSGSGKTTCLRMIAGFERPSEGRVLLHGRDVTGLAPYERDVNTVFQDYALFPHMSVVKNVEYGLRVKRVATEERRARALDALGDGAARRDERPQAVTAVGRTAPASRARPRPGEPAARVLLLDEPLGALDLKLRQEMQEELKRIQRDVGITFIYVTHDQDEALSMSDRLAVFNAGRIEQVGVPSDVYDRPATGFVASFVGTSNVFGPDLARRLRGDPRPFSVRPEKVRLEPVDGPARGDVRATGQVAEVVYLGDRTRYAVELDGGGRMVVVEQNQDRDAESLRVVRGAPVRLAWDRSADRLLEADADTADRSGQQPAEQGGTG